MVPAFSLVPTRLGGLLVGDGTNQWIMKWNDGIRVEKCQNAGRLAFYKLNVLERNQWATHYCAVLFCFLWVLLRRWTEVTWLIIPATISSTHVLFPRLSCASTCFCCLNCSAANCVATGSWVPLQSTDAAAWPPISYVCTDQQGAIRLHPGGTVKMD